MKQKKMPLICKILFGISGTLFLAALGLLIYINVPEYASQTDKIYLSYIEQGNAYYQQDRYDDSMTEFNKALTIHNDDPYLYSLRAENYHVREEHEKAIYEAKKGISCLDNKSVYYRLKGYYKFGSNKDIASYLYLYLADSAMKLKHYEEAIEAWTGMIANSKYTYSTSAYFKRGKCYYRTGDYVSALKDFKKHKEVIYQYFRENNESRYADMNPMFTEKSINKVDKWIRKCENKLGLEHEKENGMIAPPEED